MLPDRATRAFVRIDFAINRFVAHAALRSLGLPVDIVDDLKRFTVDITTLITFGHDVNTVERAEIPFSVSSRSFSQQLQDALVAAPADDTRSDSSILVSIREIALQL